MNKSFGGAEACLGYVFAAIVFCVLIPGLGFLMAMPLAALALAAATTSNRHSTAAQQAQWEKNRRRSYSVALVILAGGTLVAMFFEHSDIELFFLLYIGSFVLALGFASLGFYFDTLLPPKRKRI